MRSTFAFAATSLLAGTAFARCYTYFGPSSISPVPTSHTNTTRTLTPTVAVNHVNTTTITPATTTSFTTIVETNTQLITISSGQTLTNLVTQLTTVTTVLDPATETQVNTATTSTSSTSTMTIAAPSGFEPIQSSLPGAGYDGADGGPEPPIKKRKLRRNADGKRVRSVEKRVEAPRGLRGDKFVRSVACTYTVTEYASAVTTTRQRVKTVTGPTPTSTVTTKVTSTVSMTTVLAAQMTVTATTISAITSTISPTTTITSTSTITHTELATATAYAQCAYNNFANSVNGVPGLDTSIDGWGWTERFVDGISNAFDCCTTCAQDPNCAASAFTAAIPNHNSLACFIIDGCGTPVTAEQDDQWAFVISNGCSNTVQYVEPEGDGCSYYSGASYYSGCSG